MPELTLSGLLDYLKQELSACEDVQAPRIRPASVELDVSLAIVPGEDGTPGFTLAQSQTEAEQGALHRARIRFDFDHGPAGTPAKSGAAPYDRETLMPQVLVPVPPNPSDPEFDQADFDRMMDEIEGAPKKKKKRKKS